MAEPIPDVNENGSSDLPSKALITFSKYDSCITFSLAELIIETSPLLAFNVNIIMYCNKNTNTKLTTQSFNIVLYFASSDATVEIAILIPTYISITNNNPIAKFLNA